jgi:hypothetical protein
VVGDGASFANKLHRKYGASFANKLYRKYGAVQA